MGLFEPEKPFNTLPFLPPNIDLETPTILKACIQAHQELSKLCIAGKLIPNQTVLINSIPLLESQASSAIENIVTTTDELFQSTTMNTNAVSHEVKETLQYRSALYEGVQFIKKRPLTIATICEICSIIRGVKVDVRKIPGTTLINDRTGAKIYTPPEGEELLRRLLTNWQNFFHEKGRIDPLIQLALLHYQFEAIHPFTDGNGRTGRIINLLFLLDRDLLSEPILYLSRYIIDHRSDYYRLLLEVSAKGSWTEWIIYMLEAIRKTSKATTQKILDIQKLFKDSCHQIQSQAPQVYTKELVELLFMQPYIRISNLVEHQLAERQTASKYLQKLCEIGILLEYKAGKEKIFVNQRFLDLLKSP